MTHPLVDKYYPTDYCIEIYGLANWSAEILRRCATKWMVEQDLIHPTNLAQAPVSLAGFIHGWLSCYREEGVV